MYHVKSALKISFSKDQNETKTLVTLGKTMKHIAKL